MMCEEPLVVHRVWDLAPGAGGRRRVQVTECPDPGCTGRPEVHDHEVPCAWAWPLARGRTNNGRPFPTRRCPGCAHISRSGTEEPVPQVG